MKSNNEELVQVNIYPFGAYFLYKIKVQRGIKGNSRSKVDEIIAVGVSKSNLNKFCINKGYVITNKAVYINNDMSKPILIHDGKGNYVRN